MAVLALMTSGCSEQSESSKIPAHIAGSAESASFSDSEKITPSSLHLQDADWHNIAALTESWEVPGTDKVLKAKTQGVLVRVEENGHARVDFGRHGVHWVPVAVTDILDRARAVRAGKLHKNGGVYTLGVATRLVDSSSEKPGPYPSRPIKTADAILNVFIDPRHPDLAKMAKKLRLLEDGLGLRTVLVPQSVSQQDLDLIRETLQANNWTVPFTYPGASSAYTQLLLEEAPAKPFVQLVTPDGRILYASPLDEDRDYVEIRKRVAS